MAQLLASRLEPAPSSAPGSSRSPSPEARLSREEQLKQQLLNRRKASTTHENGPAPIISIRGRAEHAGKELIDTPSSDVPESSRAGLRGRIGSHVDAHSRSPRSGRSPPRRRSPTRPERRDDRRDEREGERENPRRSRRLRMDEDRPSYDSPPHRRAHYDPPQGDSYQRDRRSPRMEEYRDERYRRSDRRDQLPPRPLPPRSPPREAPMATGMHPDRMRMIHGNQPPPAPREPLSYAAPTMLPPLRFPPFPPPIAASSSAPPPPPPFHSNMNGESGTRADGEPVINAPNWTAPPPRRLGFGGGLDFEKRRLEREQSKISIWPPSPKEPWRDPDEVEAERREAKRAARRAKAARKDRKVRRRRYSSEIPSSDDDSADDTRRRKGRRRRYSDESSSDESRRSVSDGESRRKRKRGTSSVARSTKDEGTDAWVEKPAASSAPVRLPRTMAERDALILPGTVPEGDSDEEVGPKLPGEPGGRKERHQFFSGMLPGEAEAMAAYAAAGQRIPRRGEVGLDADRIAQFEESGYVMSGNRNKKMNAVRLRKENQVISAEEKRAILNLQREERVRKEGAIISQFKELMDQNLRKQGLHKE